MKYLFSTAAIAALAFFPASASAQLFGGLDNSTVLGGAAGAGLGGVIGSQLAPSGNRTEGSAIGAVVGGLAGAAYGNSQSNYYGNPYAGQFNPGFNGQNLAGTAIGAGLGGVIGSNLAGSGQREEGTAIGAVLGGLAGYSLANGRSNARYGGQAYGGGYGGSYGAPAPVTTYGQNYNLTLPGTYRGAPAYYGGTPQPLPAAPYGNSVTYAPGGYVSGPIIPVTTYTAPRVERRVIRKRIRVEPQIVHRQRIVVDQPCPSGTTQQSDGTCMSAPRVVHAPAPTVIPAQCPAGTTDMGNGTCQEPAKTVYGAAPIVIPQACPAGTTDLGNGTCQEPAKTVLGAAPIVIPQSCPAGTTDMGDGTCQEPAKKVYGAAPIVIPQACPTGTTDLGNGTCQEPPKTIMGSAPIVINQPCPAGTTDLGNGTCEAPARVVEQAPVYVTPAPATPTCPVGTSYDGNVCIDHNPGVMIQETIESDAYCYGDGKRMYDSSGRIIPGYRHDAASCKKSHH